MAESPDYDVLVLTSNDATLDELVGIANRHFRNPTVLFWEMGNMAAKPELYEQIQATQYNVIISHFNGLILKRRHLERAQFGALNVHPAPPEHGGAFGIWCQPVIRREVRTHHGVTVHEMDLDIDHGPIYEVRRWDVGADATIQSVVERSAEECLAVCDRMAAQLSRSPNGTRCFRQIDEAWHPTNRHHTVADVREWFEALDPAHPAHQERVPFNHPRAIIEPPYFDDV